jgi:hypothetical protein
MMLWPGSGSAERREMEQAGDHRSEQATTTARFAPRRSESPAHTREISEASN